MSLSACVHCWETVCVCGHDYKSWPSERITQLVAVLQLELSLRAPAPPPPEFLRCPAVVVETDPGINGTQCTLREGHLGPHRLPPPAPPPCDHDWVLGICRRCGSDALAFAFVRGG